MEIFVGNISYTSTEDDLWQLFEGFGTVERVNLILDRDTGRSRGFGFVGMPHEDEAEGRHRGPRWQRASGPGPGRQPGAPARAAAEARLLVGREIRW